MHENKRLNSDEEQMQNFNQQTNSIDYFAAAILQAE